MPNFDPATAAVTSLVKIKSMPTITEPLSVEQWLVS
jgi:hypothetical protein